MGTKSSKPDLFSFASKTKTNPSTSVADAAVPTSVFRHVLPSNLPHAMEQLTDRELDQLLSAVISEQNRRGKKLSVSHENSRKRQIESVAVPLTQGKLNAVRAAFKAGVTPSRIARQFGISQSDVRKALTGTSTRR
jgi:hypothetical protein